MNPRLKIIVKILKIDYLYLLKLCFTFNNPVYSGIIYKLYSNPYYIIKMPSKIFQLFCFVILCCAIISCSQDDPSSSADENLYELKNIEFYLADDDQNTFSFDHLDMLSFTNHSNSSLPDTTFYPFQTLKDTLLVKINTPTNDFKLKDSIAFRNMMINPDHSISYLSNDSIYISEKAHEFIFPVTHKSEELTLKPNPETHYEITGNYWRIRYTISFEARAIHLYTEEETTLQGKLFYSIVSRGTRPEEEKDKAPSTHLKATEIP